MEEIQQADDRWRTWRRMGTFEITPQAADSVIFVKAAFLKVFGEIPPKA
jgi:hypothetical protein